MQLVRRALAVLSAVSLSLALAMPALAATAKAGIPEWACAPGESGAGAAARGPVADRDGRIREKDVGQVAKALPASAQGRAPGNSSITVPVYWHVITSGTEGAVTNSQIAAQISALNAGFGGGEGGDDTGFSFALAGVTRTNDATWYASRSAGAEHAMKQALKQGGDGDLNVYSTSGGAYLGWAYLPEITDTAQRYLDGIVIDWRTMPGVSDAYEGLYDEGDTLTHEAGHWLNLEHTFYGQCNKTGDFVADTPAQKSPSSGCPEGNDTCRQPGLDPIHNYMDYSDDPCLTEFTPGQTQRMLDSWLLWRAS
jgi:Pregnancy-associated plasma protein-A